MKSLYLGINSSNNRCCIIDVPIDLTRENVAEVMEYARYSATNWDGCDQVSRTCELRKYDLSDEVLPYCGEYHWRELDCGHTYEGIFRFDKLVKVLRVRS